MSETHATSRTVDVRAGTIDASAGDACLRLVLAALFLVSAATKFRAPLDFAFAIKAFHFGFGESRIVFFAYLIPWIEGLLGVFLLLSIWTRAAALLAAVLMAGFIAAITSLIVRGLDVACPCFGTLRLFCDGPMGRCHIIRNTVIALIAMRVVVAYRPRAIDRD